MVRLLKLLAIALTLSQAIPSLSFAKDETGGHPLKIGGDYQVTAIDRISDHEFHIEFKSVVATGKFDTLSLHSNHVHVAVRVGQKLRLSAAILNTRGSEAEVAQMVIFVPNPQGAVPVWLLSNRAEGLDLRATKYLEMHSPLTDYLVM